MRTSSNFDNNIQLILRLQPFSIFTVGPWALRLGPCAQGLVPSTLGLSPQALSPGPWAESGFGRVADPQVDSKSFWTLLRTVVGPFWKHFGIIFSIVLYTLNKNYNKFLIKTMFVQTYLHTSVVPILRTPLLPTHFVLGVGGMA